MPLNNATIGGGGPTGCPPQYVPPNITSNNVPIDGWYFKNYDTNHKKIQWGYAFADQVGSYSLNLLTDVNQVYFSCYINKATTAGDSPFLVIYTYGTQNIYYKQAIKYVSSTNITTPGYYTFIANISGNSNIKPFVLGSANNANNIIELNYSTSSVPSGYNSLSAMNTASSLSAAYYLTIQTNSVSTVNNVDLFLTDLYIETNGHNSNIPVGTYNYKFTNTVVSNQFLYTALNNLYNKFYQTDIQNTILPGDSSYSGY